MKPTDKFPNGTHLQGYVNATYEQLVATFGPPNQDGDDYKVAFEWVLETDDGQLITIYPWKNTLLYGDGLPSPETMKRINTNWHIGGKSPNVVAAIHAALGVK